MGSRFKLYRLRYRLDRLYALGSYVFGYLPTHTNSFRICLALTFIAFHEHDLSGGVLGQLSNCMWLAGRRTAFIVFSVQLQGYPLLTECSHVRANGSLDRRCGRTL